MLVVTDRITRGNVLHDGAGPCSQQATAAVEDHKMLRSLANERNRRANGRKSTAERAYAVSRLSSWTERRTFACTSTLQRLTVFWIREARLASSPRVTQTQVE